MHPRSINVPTVDERTVEAIVAALSGYDRLVEVGIGSQTAVARALAAAGQEVLATDIHPRPTPEGVAFVRDDVTAPDLAIYEDAGAIYALNLPPELHRPTLDVARKVDADCYFTTLGGDEPAVEVCPRTVGRDTLYRAR